MKFYLLFILLYPVCFLSGYIIGKYLGFSQGLRYMKKMVSQSVEGHEHYCNIMCCNVVCFEREGELWVKEYCGMHNEPEGRTYMVFHCPWCGYQTKKSKLQEKLKLMRSHDDSTTDN